MGSGQHKAWDKSAGGKWIVGTRQRPGGRMTPGGAGAGKRVGQKLVLYKYPGVRRHKTYDIKDQVWRE